LTQKEVKRVLTATDPAYGQDFTEAEWEAVTEQLCALAGLYRQISSRRAAGADGAETEPPSERKV
jgi:hypothetical protein